MKPTKDYRDARARAQALANRLGADVGLEYNSLFREYSIFGLPRKANRCGHELRCEVVYPENLDNCQPGHGPCA